MKPTVFLHATHPTLVNQESYTFYKHGYDVYTTAWATGKMSNVPDDKVEFPKKHFYQGACDFLSENDIQVLSKIDTKMRSSHNDDVQKVINKFDVLYVSQITPWVINYGLPFLRTGKPVIFRTFGFPLHAWGSPSDLKELWEFSNFYVLPTDWKEVEIGIYTDKPNVIQIMASIHKELFTLNTTVAEPKFAMSVMSGSLSGEEFGQALIGRVLPWTMVNRGKSYITNAELENIYNSCYLYLDFTEKLFRYSVFESLMYEKPVLVLHEGDMSGYMKRTGFCSSLQRYHTGFEDTNTFLFWAMNSGARDQLLRDELEWFNTQIKEAEEKWSEFFKCLKV